MFKGKLPFLLGKIYKHLPTLFFIASLNFDPFENLPTPRLPHSPSPVYKFLEKNLICLNIKTQHSHPYALSTHPKVP